MIILVVLSGDVVACLATAALYDRRARRRGLRAGMSTTDIEQRQGTGLPPSH